MALPITLTEVARMEARGADLIDALVDAISMLATASAEPTRSRRFAEIQEVAALYRNTDSDTCLTAPVIEVVRRARDLVQAEHACNLGRHGAEDRRKTCMDELRKALTAIRFTD